MNRLRAQYQLEYKDGTYEFQPIINGKKRDPKGIYPDLNVAAYVLRKGPNLFVPIIHITKYKNSRSIQTSANPVRNSLIRANDGSLRAGPQIGGLLRKLAATHSPPQAIANYLFTWERK